LGCIAAAVQQEQVSGDHGVVPVEGGESDCNILFFGLYFFLVQLSRRRSCCEEALSREIEILDYSWTLHTVE
jgi:hypothetical protein